MERIHLDQPWIDRLVPDGFPTRTSTLISGPGGSGKPLIGNLFVASWLRHGGSVVFMSLQYPDYRFIIGGLKQVAGVDLADFGGRTCFIELDATIDGIDTVTGNHLKANLVIPDVWDGAIEHACSMVPSEGPGILVFGSALNLLLFSPTHGEEILARMKRTIESDKRRAYLYSVSTTAKRRMIAELEVAADNLMMSRMVENPSRLFMQILRMKDTTFDGEEVEVPLNAEKLEEMKKIADHSRKVVIPLISSL